MIEMLLYWGANPAMVDDEGRSAIDLARYHKMPAGVIFMLEKRCSVFSRDIDYCTGERRVHAEPYYKKV